MTHFHFFIDADRVETGAIVLFEGPEFHHARDVLRIGPGESVTLINGRGLLATGVIESIDRRHGTVRILSSEQHTSPPPISLGLGLLRFSHLDLAIEKGTEVGVDRFVLFLADRSERREVSPSIHRRLDAILASATKQSGRLFRPQVTFVSSLSEALPLLSQPLLWADPAAGARPLSLALETLPHHQPLSILIGPESGWSDREKALLLNQGPPILLHANILRAETAAIVGAYALSLHRDILQEEL